jgi:ABC-type amino acid transport system permease subunit
MNVSLKNNDCFYFVNKHIQLLYYQLFSFVLCFIFILFVFLNSLENLQQHVGHSTSTLCRCFFP